MSKQGRVVAIYHKETRKELGYIPCSVITKQTRGDFHKYAIAYRNPVPFLSPGPQVTQINYEVVHDGKGNPIKVIAESQRDADKLIHSHGVSQQEQIADALNEPNSVFELLEEIKA